jgi:hypothetical protein
VSRWSDGRHRRLAARLAVTRFAVTRFAVALSSSSPAPARRSPGDEPARPRRCVQIALVVAVVLVGLGIIFAVPWLRHAFQLCLHGDLAGLRAYIKGLGACGLALLVGLMLMHA